MDLSKTRATGTVKAEAKARRYAEATLMLIPSFMASLYITFTAANAICTNTIKMSGFNVCNKLLTFFMFVNYYAS